MNEEIFRVMKNENTSETPVVNLLVGFIDVVVVLLSIYMTYHIVRFFDPYYVFFLKLKTLLVLGFLSYIPAFLYFPPLLYRRIVHVDKIIERVFHLILLYIILYFTVLTILKGANVPYHYILSLTGVTWLLLSIERVLLRKLVKSIRKKGKNQKKVIFVGLPEYFQKLYKEISDPNYGFKIAGIFYNKPEKQDLTVPIPYLGTTDQVTEYLKSHQDIKAVYCTVQEGNPTDTKNILRYCENSVVRFYAIPIYLNQLRKRMVVIQQGSNMLLTSRNEPLDNINNALIKRGFDLFCSTLFLTTLFPIIYVIVAAIIKKQSPGPVLFKQERSGLNGKVFVCYKFRSMHVNKDADKIQATLNDPRKFKFGDFMRKTNIDELPQFINVWLGDMSMVGPRPHMLLHTEQYSQLIKEYMVRHWVKPGITGWAQVLGFRGETKELKQMEDRVRADIWYVENWNFWLDLKIIWKTIWNTITRSEKNAY